MAETGIPQSLICPNGDTLVFNDWANEETNGLLMITDVQGLDGPVIRLASDDRPQRPGVILHTSQYGARLVTIRGRYIPPGGNLSAGVTMHDRLRAAADSLLQADGRYLWTPSGQAQRFLTVRDNDQFAMDHDSSLRSQDGQALIKEFTFNLIAADPIVRTLTEIDFTGVLEGTTVTVTNGGKVDATVVFEVHGPYTGFTIENVTTGLKLVFGTDGAGSALSIALGHYIEIIGTAETAYKDGTGADQLFGLDVAQSDFFTLAPGANMISFSASGTGFATARLDIKTNDAWG